MLIKQLIPGTLYKFCCHTVSPCLEEFRKTEIPFQHFNSASFTGFLLKLERCCLYTLLVLYFCLSGDPLFASESSSGKKNMLVPDSFVYIVIDARQSYDFRISHSLLDAKPGFCISCHFLLY